MDYLTAIIFVAQILLTEYIGGLLVVQIFLFKEHMTGVFVADKLLTEQRTKYLLASGCLGHGLFFRMLFAVYTSNVVSAS